MKIEYKTLEELQQMHEYGPVKGVYKVIDDDYHAFKAGVNSTSIKAASISLAHYNSVAHPDENAPVSGRPDYFTFGSAFHAYMLDKEEFNKSFIVKPKVDMRTKEGKAWKAENAHRSILTTEDMYKIKKMAENVYASDYWNHFTDGEYYTELAMFWVCELSGMQCKSKVDLLSPMYGILDLKTTGKTITDREIYFGYKNYKYQIQEAHYVAGLRACIPSFSESFTLGWVEKAAPYSTRASRLEDASRTNAESEYKQLMVDIAYANQNNSYPSLGMHETLEIKL